VGRSNSSEGWRHQQIDVLVESLWSSWAFCGRSKWNISTVIIYKYMEFLWNRHVRLQQIS
jgi:hypothetical protein